jgi:large subunit ribosomal protein L20
MNDINYSQLMHGLKLSNVDINRKMLADLAYNDADAFKAIADQAKAALAK